MEGREEPTKPSWDFGFGRGRPGWHLECSAMALRLLGEPPIDIHCGGVDLIFPHHENEIAQSEGATNKQFARFWVHVEHLLIDEEKMSKSLGNVFNLPDIVAKGYRPSTLRYLLISTHYRKQVKFSWDAMSQAEESLRRLADFVARLDRVTAAGAHPDIAAKVSAAEAQFKEAMEQDLNTAGALGAMFELVRVLNAAIDSNELGTGDVPVVKAAFDRFDRVLGVLALRARRGSTDRAAGRRDRSPRRRAPGRAQAPRLRGGRSHPAAAARRGDRAGGLADGDAVETEVRRLGIRGSGMRGRATC